MADKEKKVSVDKKIMCFHCGDVCRKDHVVFEGKDFCCNGCKTVYEILNQNDLCTYYDLEKNPGISLRSKKFDDKYAYLDNDEISRQILDFQDQHHAKVTFFIPAIHCSSCIWLLENLYKLREGVRNSRVNFVRKEISIDYDPNVIRLRQIVELLATLGYEPAINLGQQEKKRKKNTHRDLYLKIGVAGFAFGNIMLLSFPEYFGFEGISEGNIRLFINYLNIFLSLPVVFYCASDYFRSAYSGIRNKYVNIDVPIALGIIVLFLRSLYEIISQSGPGYLDSLSGLLFFLLVGRWFQNFTYEGLSFERDYTSYFPLAVYKLVDGKTESTLIRNLVKGDIIRVRNREIIPSDSTLLSGSAQIDYSFVTGESGATPAKKGDHVFAGGRQIGESIDLEVLKPVSQSYLTQLWNNEAFSKDKDLQFKKMIDVIGKYFTLVVLVIAITGFLMWYKTDFRQAMNALTAVLIVACPCALSLSVPFTFGSTMRIFGRLGFYLKNVQVIEKLLKITHIVFDKTGTLTYNENQNIRFEGNASDAEFSKIKALVMHSTHPLSRILADSIDLPEKRLSVSEFEEIAGKGLKANVDGNLIMLGNRDFVQGRAMSGADRMPQDSTTEVFVSENLEVLGKFLIRNKYRKGIHNTIQQLKKDYEMSLLTGDNDSERENLQEIFGKDALIHFRQSPEDKLEWIRKLQSEGQHVLMIGDGLNDAGALQQSEVGISVTEDISNFTPASDVIIKAGTLKAIPSLLGFARISRNIVWVAFVISFMYNITGIGFAVTGHLTPLVAAILMPLSSISVVVFATTVTNLMAKINRIL